MTLSLPPFFRKFAIPILSGVIILVCLVVFALNFSTVSELKQAVADVDMTVRKMQRNIQNSENLETQLAQIEELTDEVAERTIEPGDAAVNTAYFYRFETDGLKIVSVGQADGGATNAKGPWSMNNFGTTFFTIQAEGKFQEIMDFAFRLRAGDKIVRIVDMSVSPAGRNASKERQISLTLEALTQAPETK